MIFKVMTKVQASRAQSTEGASVQSALQSQQLQQGTQLFQGICIHSFIPGYREPFPYSYPPSSDSFSRQWHPASPIIFEARPRIR